MEQKTSANQPFSNRLIHGQRGNALVYIFLFSIAWIAFFGIKGWIYETKEARAHPVHAQESKAAYWYDQYRSYR